MSDQTTLTDAIDAAEDDGASDATDARIHEPEPVTHPPEALTFRVSGEWAHFKRIDGNLVKETYRIPPRTTVAGLVAAILGIGRDQYYDLFARGHSAVAVEPCGPLRTVNMPLNTLTTANTSEGLQKVNSRGGGPTLVFTDSSQNRQQHNYEVLTDPEYRIHVWLDDDEQFDRLERYLEAGKSHYTPSLGLSEYLATVKYEGRHTVEPIATDAPVDVDSAVPDGPRRMQITADSTYRTERSPGYMSLTTGTTGFTRRQTDAFIDYAYTLDGSPVTVTDADDAANVAGRTVIFR